MRLKIICLSSLLLASCIPYEHEQQESPELHGVLVDNGKPVADATVLLVVNPADTMTGCPDTAKSVKTDANGNFYFPRATYHQSVLPFASNRIDFWRICFNQADGKQAAWLGRGIWGGPQRQDLRCDLNAPTDPKAERCTAKNSD